MAILLDNLKGILEIVILKLISEKEMYGYELASELNRRSESFNITEGTLLSHTIQARGRRSDGNTMGAISFPGTAKILFGYRKGKQVMAESYSQWKAIVQDIAKIMEGLV